MMDQVTLFLDVLPRPSFALSAGVFCVGVAAVFVILAGVFCVGMFFMRSSSRVQPKSPPADEGENPFRQEG
ncbi:MAG TPA: hypothetical protein DCY79_25900 [Planctomycetaceae bacterium]|nr:hypothetical protein [Blastopirellula sp.]HAY83255.1 hypothetical protein [Planctomycetaceae bacterium]